MFYLYFMMGPHRRLPPHYIQLLCCLIFMHSPKSSKNYQHSINCVFPKCARKKKNSCESSHCVKYTC